MAIDIILQRNNKKNYKLLPTEKDIKLVENLSVRKVKNNHSNFEKIVISKPWGAEYLCGRNKNFEIWELYINPRSSTSLHCHPEKDTLNIILEGRAAVESIKKKEIISAGECRLIKAGAIHRTANISSKNSLRLLEIESPPNKYNLIRVNDNYGRESKGYTSENVKNYLNNGIKIKHCLQKENKKNSLHCKIYPFIFKEKMKNNNDVQIFEVCLTLLNFDANKKRFLDNLKSHNIKNIIIVEGSTAINNNKFFYNLLPGNCILDVPLWKFNWSASKAKILIW